MSGPVEWQGSPETLAALAADPSTAGESACPMCGRTWTVTMWADCFLPACGCYGHDTSEANPNRPCESCGLAHARACLNRLGER